MSDSDRRQRGGTVLRFAPAEQRKVIAMARTLELYSKTFPTRHRLLMLLETWLFAADRDGVSERQPEYVEGLKRAIGALESSQSVDQAIARLRAQEAACWSPAPRRPPSA